MSSLSNCTSILVRLRLTANPLSTLVHSCLPASNITCVSSVPSCQTLAYVLSRVHPTLFSWILGHDYCCAEVSSKDTEGHPTQISLKDWEGVPPGHPTLKPHPDGWEVIRPPRDLIQPFPPHVLYYDRGLVRESYTLARKLLYRHIFADSPHSDLATARSSCLHRESILQLESNTSLE